MRRRTIRRSSPSASSLVRVAGDIRAKPWASLTDPQRYAMRASNELARRRTEAAQQAAQGADEQRRQADDLLSQVRTLQERAIRLLDASEGAGNYRAAIMGIREARGCLELLAKLQGQLDDRPVVNVLISPQWVQLRTVILSTHAAYPEARAALAAALQRVDQ
jgi:hypothetical protein